LSAGAAEGGELQRRLAELRQGFDSGFAAAPPEAAGEYEDMLLIPLGAETYRVRLRDIAGMYLDRSITALPSRAPHLLGVSDFRGELVAVYDLASLLGYPRSERRRYLLRGAHQAVGFAFERFLGHARVLRGAESGQSIIDLDQLVGELERSAAGAAAKEA
jgi:hypothetical protein